MAVKYVNIYTTSSFFPEDCSLDFDDLIEQVANKLNKEYPDSNYILNGIPCRKRVKRYIVKITNDYIRNLRFQHHCPIEMPRETSLKQVSRLAKTLKARKHFIRISAYSLIILLVIFEYLDDVTYINQLTPYFNFVGNFAIAFHGANDNDALGTFLANCSNVIQVKIIINHGQHIAEEDMPPTLTKN